MKLILENPYRILGLPITASDRDIAKRGDDLAMYIEMGMTKKFEHDYLFNTNPISRTKETLHRALSQLELGNQKIFHSAFWFSNSNSVDQLALELVKEGGLDKAEQFWAKQMSNEVSSKNASNYRNFAIFKILQLNGNDDNYLDDFLVHGKSLFQGNNYSNDNRFLQKIGGDNNQIGQSDIQLFLMEELQKHIFNKSNKNSGRNIQKEFLEIFNDADESLRAKAVKQFTDEPIHRLELALEECQQQRQSDSSISKIVADKLFAIAVKHLTHLESILSKRDIHYQFIADKIANELLACSTHYFNWVTKEDNSFKPLDISKEITNKAKQIAVSDEVRRKINDDLNTIEDLRKQKKFELILNVLVTAIKKLPPIDSISSNQIQNIPRILQGFLDETLPTLMSIKYKNLDEYREWSTVFVNITLNYGAQYVQKSSQPNFSALFLAVKKVQNLHMDDELEDSYNHIYNIIKTRSDQQSSSQSSSQNLSQSSSGGCYIATLVYGDYNSPEVLVLRRFRDNFLAKSKAGRLFIKFYYSTSPSLVKALKNQHFIQNGIKKILDSLVKRLSK